MIRIAYWVVCMMLLGACGKPRPFNAVVMDVKFDLPGVQNYEGELELALDYTDAIDQGFVIPSETQALGGVIPFSFRVNDTTGQGRRFAYKLYYQNESYKFPEVDHNGKKQPLAEENFYGGWEEASEGFRTTEGVSEEGLVVRETFRIRGDPRDEQRFSRDGAPAPWARNPRVGVYEFLLVIIAQEDLENDPLPAPVIDISEQDGGHFVNPFWYFLHGPGSTRKDIAAMLADERLNVIAKPDLGAGIFSKPDEGASRDAFSAQCGEAPDLREHAAFEQFIHYVDSSTLFQNIPVIADVVGNQFTPDDHDHHRAFFPKERMIATGPRIAHLPCATVSSDPERKAIMIKNPASTLGNERKENVGVITRHGLMYGSYKVKCKLNPLLNDSGMWTGLTNAIWLIGQNAPGNLRRVCDDEGYMKTYWGGPDDERVPQVEYAEIDFEILKTPPYCPEREFPPLRPQAWADPNSRSSWSRTRHDPHRELISIACTNWDMACHTPEDFNVGCHPSTVGDLTFDNHRWDHDYRALTQKTEALDDELFGDEPFWFEIDWRPTEIYWRVGPDLDHMRLVGYMNDKVTMIPNVQMQLIISQEFHNTQWWPGSPFEQGFVPFPAEDYVGEILEVIVE